MNSIKINVWLSSKEKCFNEDSVNGVQNIQLGQV